MWKKTVNIIFALVLTGCAAKSDSSFLHAAEIEMSGGNQYKAVRLAPQIYNASNSDLSDLLIRDGKGENVPYFINTRLGRTYSNTETYQMALINSYLKDDNFYFDYKLAAEQSGDVISTSVEFATGNVNFAKEVDIYGSYDNIHWDYVQKDRLYSIDDKTKLFIDFKRPQKFTHYRMKLANNLEKISFDAVYLVYSVETSEETNFVENLTPAFTVESADKRTNIHIEGLKNLRLCDITIHTDSMFKRNVSAPGGTDKEIYNLSLNGESYADTTIPLYWHVPKDDTYILAIHDGDDKPINISGVAVNYYADDVVFEGRPNEKYTLVFGGGAEKAAPVYDIERYRDDVLKGEIDRVAIGEIHYATEEIKPERDYRLAFNIVIIAVALMLGALISFKLKKVKPG